MVTGPLTGAAWLEAVRRRIQGLVMGCAWMRFQMVSAESVDGGSGAAAWSDNANSQA